MAEVMLKHEGDPVEANEALAVLPGRFAFLQRTVRAPVAGRIATIGPGWVLLELERRVTRLPAFVYGLVANIIPNRGVMIEASGAVIEAACGFGGEAFGRLKRLVNSPFDTIEAAVLDDSLEQSIVIGGRTIDEEILRRAESKQVRGIIVGSFDVSLLNLDPKPNIRLVATEGFGHIPMPAYTFGILNTLVGREVSVRGQTPTLAPATLHETGQARPIILSTIRQSNTATRTELPAKTEPGEVVVGSRVRVTRGPLFGAIGQVQAIPAEPPLSEIGLNLPGAQVTIDGSPRFIPWANLEQII
jgi:hypothetical protein